MDEQFKRLPGSMFVGPAGDSMARALADFALALSPETIQWIKQQAAQRKELARISRRGPQVCQRSGRAAE